MANEAEGQQNIREAQDLLAMMQAPGWEIAKRLYTEFIKDLDTIREIDFKKFGIEEGMARQLAIGIMERWMGELEARTQSLEEYRREKERRERISPLYKTYE